MVCNIDLDIKKVSTQAIKTTKPGMLPSTDVIVNSLICNLLWHASMYAFHKIKDGKSSKYIIKYESLVVSFLLILPIWALADDVINTKPLTKSLVLQMLVLSSCFIINVVLQVVYLFNKQQRNKIFNLEDKIKLLTDKKQPLEDDNVKKAINRN